MQFLVQDSCGWFLAARETHRRYQNSTQSCLRAHEIQNNWEVQQGLETGQGRYMKVPSLGQFSVKDTAGLQRPQLWPRFSINGQVKTALFHDKSSTQERPAQDLCPANSQLLPCQQTASPARTKNESDLSLCLLSICLREAAVKMPKEKPRAQIMRQDTARLRLRSFAKTTAIPGGYQTGPCAISMGSGEIKKIMATSQKIQLFK